MINISMDNVASINQCFFKGTLKYMEHLKMENRSRFKFTRNKR